MRIRILASLGLAALALAGCTREEKPQAVTTVEADGVKTTIAVTDAWCRATPNGARAGACYMTLKASSAEQLTGVATPAAAVAQIHQMSMTDGMMQMSEMPDGLPLPADQAVELKPGGAHIMLVGLTGPLVDGAVVELTLGFKTAPALKVQAPVRLPDVEGATEKK